MIKAVLLACTIFLAGFPQSVIAQEGAILKLSTADQKAITDMLGSQVMIEAMPAKSLQAVEVYLPKNVPAQSYSVRQQGKAARTEIHRILPAAPQDPPGSTRYDVEKVSTLVLTSGSDGSVSVVQEYDLDKKVISTFTPGEPLIIPGLAPGQSRNVGIAVSVADIDDPTDIDYKGKLDVTYTHLGTYRIKIPSGSYEADLIKWTYSGDIGPASVETAQYRFLAKGAGMVAMVEWRSISAVLIYHEKSRLGKILAKAP